MDTTSYAWAAEISAARHGMVALTLALLCVGCKSPPSNPFLARHQRDEAAAQDSAPAAAKELADEVEAAFDATAQQARQAVDQTLTDGVDRARQVGAHAVDASQTAASEASSTVQLRAIESLAAWPIEQAGPMLLLAIAEGGTVTRRAAAKQLAERWPPAADFPVDAAGQNRATALAELRKLWTRQYGEINDVVVAAKAHAQQVLDDTQQVVSDARQVAYDAEQVVKTAAEGTRQVQDLVASLKQANLPEVARREAVATLERLALDANWEIRARVARAMGELADPAFLPVLMNMLADQVEVQREALASLSRVVGDDAIGQRAGMAPSTDEQVRRWQLWYQEHPRGREARR